MSIIIREVVKKDFEVLAQFLSSSAAPHFTVREYLDKFNFWWLNNPYFRDNDCFGWLIADDNRKDYIKGFLGNIPADYRYGASVFTTASPTTWCVDEKYKKHAIYLFFSFYSQKKELLVNSTASPVTREISLKFGCEDLTRDEKTLLKPLSHQIFLFLLMKKVKLKPMALLLAHFLFLMLYMYIRIAEKISCRGRALDIREAFEYDILKDLQEKGGNLYLENLGWIMRNDKDKKLFIISEAGSDKTGYFLVQYVRNRVNALNYLQVIDSVNADPYSLNAVQDKILAAFIDRKIDFILLPNFSGTNFRRSGYLDITPYMPSTCLVYGQKKDEIRNAGITALFGEKGFILWHS